MTRQDSSGAGGAEEGSGEQGSPPRREARSAAIKSVRLAYGGLAAAGVLMDYSSTGARVFVRSKNSIDPMLPDQVTLELNDGTVLPALIRWRRDGYVGLEFTGGADPNAARLAAVRTVQEMLNLSDLSKAMRVLSERAWFGDPEIGDAARTIEQALGRLRTRLEQIIDRRG